jgi:hypothetical protein
MKKLLTLLILLIAFQGFAQEVVRKLVVQGQVIDLAANPLFTQNFVYNNTAGDFTVTTEAETTIIQLDRTTNIDVILPASPSLGDSYTFQQMGEGKLQFNVNDKAVANTLRTNKEGAVVQAIYDGTDWNLFGSVEQYSAFVNAYEDASLKAYFEADDIEEADAYAVTSWGATNNAYLLNAPAGNEPELNIRPDGAREVVFTAANSDYLVMDADHADINFNPGSDEYTIIVAFGNVSPGATQVLFGKREYSSANSQFGVGTNSSGDNMTLSIGGGSTNIPSAKPDVADGFWVLRRDASGVDLIVNGVEIISNYAAGTTVRAEKWQLSGRGNIANQPADMAVKAFALYNTALSDAKITEIYNQEAGL